MLAKEKNNRIVLSYIRKTGMNSNFSKQKALLMLWKAELIAIADAYPQIALKKSFTRDEIAAAISFGITKDDALESIQSAIVRRALNTIHNESDVSDGK